MSQHGASRHGLRASQCQRRLRIAAVLSVGSLLLGALTAQSSHAVAAQIASSATVLTVDEPVLDPIDAAAEEAAASGDDVVVEEYTTETQLMSVTPQGQLRAALTAVPVRVEDGPSGEWVPIDTDLVEQPDGSFAPRHAVSDISISGGGDSELVAVENGAGAGVGLGWRDELPAPVIEGPTATYLEVLPGVDLVARASATGFSTYLVVKSAAAAANPVLDSMDFPVDSGDLDVVDAGDGTLQVVGDQGAVFETSQAMMWDSKGIPDSQEGDAEVLTDQPVLARNAEVDVALTPGGDMSVAPDQALLNSTTVDYPIVIDPEWHESGVKNDTAWAMVWSNSNDWYNSSAQAPRVGYDGWSSAKKKSRSFYKFDLPDALIGDVGVKIDEAQMTMRMVHSPNHACNLGSYGPAVEVYRVANFGSGVSWPGPDGEGLQGTLAAATGHEDLCPPKNKEVEVTAGIKEAYTEGKSFVAFGLRSANESNQDGWRKFANGEYPEVVVWYDRPPAVGGSGSGVAADYRACNCR